MNDILSITKGNDFTLLLDLTRKLPAEDSVAEPVVDSTTDVCLLTSCGKRITVPRTAEAHVLGWKLVTVNDRQQLAITIPSSVQQIDSYGLEVKGIVNGDNWRFKAKPGETFNIVDTTNEQNIPDDQVRIYNMCYMIGIGSQNQDMTGYATEQWVREQHYLTEHQSLSGYATEQWVNEQNFLKQHQDISGKEDKMQIVSYAQSATAITVEFGYNKIGFDVNTLAITLPTVETDVATLKGLLIKFTTGANPDISFTNNNVIFADAYDTPASSIVELNAIYDGDNWYITSQKFNAQNS